MNIPDLAAPFLEVHLLGSPEFRREGKVLPALATHKTVSLLAYLILHKHCTHSRDKLATLFWGDREDVRARHSLATALWSIRRLLSDDYLFADSVSVQFNPAIPFWLDVSEFENLLTAGRDPQHTTDCLKQAVALYRGDLLEGFYDDWYINERYHLEALYLDALNQLVTLCEEQGEAAAALQYARLYLAKDPLQENMHIAAMRALISMGNPTGARRQWQLCCEAWQLEHQGAPSPDMLKAAENILGVQFAIPLPVTGDETITLPRRGTPEQPPFVGRARELDVLLMRWEQAVQGSGGLILIGGEAGVGKTRLTEELAAAVRWRGGLVVRGHCCRAECVIPYQPIAEMLRGLMNKSPEVKALPGWARIELARLVPNGGESQSVDEPGERGTRLLQAIAALVCQIATHAPFVIVLEDLHWADHSTLACLDYLARQIFAMRVLLIGTFRPEEIGDAHALSMMTTQLTRDGLAQHLWLELLSPKAVSELAGRVCECDAEFAGRLYAHTEGNAFFLIETLRELDISIPSHTRHTGETALPVPRTARALIQSRLAHLTAPALKLVAYAAVTGRAFDFDVVCRAAGMSEEAALEGIDELLLRGFLREGTDIAGYDYEFSHSLTHEVAYTNLHHRRRRQLHRLVGEAMETLLPTRRVEYFGTLAHHFDRADVCAKALNYAEQAALHALSLGAASETRQYYDIALRCLERIGAAVLGECSYRQRRFDLLLGLEQAFDILARRTEQAVILERLTELAEAPGEEERRAQVHLRRFWFNYPKQLADARCEAERALALARQRGNRTIEVQALYAIALTQARSEEPARGLEYARAALAQARELGDRSLEGWSLLQLGFIYKQMNDWDRAQATLGEALAFNRAVGNQLAIGRALIHLGDVNRARGDLKQANQHYREALALAQEIGYRWVEDDARSRLAEESD